MAAEVYKMQMPTISSKNILQAKFNISAHHDWSFFVQRMEDNGDASLGLINQFIQQKKLMTLVRLTIGKDA